MAAGANDRSVARDRHQQKRAVRLATGVALVVGALVVIGFASSLMTSLTDSEEQLAVFTDAAELPSELRRSVEWAPDAPGLRREMEPLTREDITDAWLRAWEQMFIVSQTGDVSGVEIYFSNSAREGVLANAENWGDTSVRQLGHELELTFYSEDGQVVGLRSIETTVEYRESDGERALTRVAAESYETVLVLEDGNWRIHHWVRQSFDPGEWVAVSPESLAADAPGQPSR